MWLQLSVLFVLLMTSTIVEASHFRFGHFTFESRPDISDSTADFRMTVAFRSSAFGHPNIGQTFSPGSYYFGDGKASNHYFRVIARNLQEDWIVGEAIDTRNENDIVRHTYPAPNNNGNPWLGRFESCCKIGGLRNSGRTWRVYTRINLEDGNSSPFSNLPPIVSCSKYDCRFLIPAVDRDGDKMTWRMSTRSESAINGIPSGMQIDSQTGLFTWEGAESFSNGLYTVQVTIEDRDEEGNVKSTAAIDFLLKLQEQGANDWPVFDHPPTPEAGSRIKAVVGQKLTLTVQATDPNPNDQVFLNHVGLPSDATFEQTLSGGTTGVATLEWTPTTADMGEHLVTFLANDNRGGASSPVAVNIEVIKPAISNVRIKSSISSTDIQIDNSSFSVPPSEISIENDQTVVSWAFDTFSVGQLENLNTTLGLYNLTPGEQRVITNQLELSYIDIDGNPVSELLPSQSVKVAPTLNVLNVDTDKDIYSPSEQVEISSLVKNLSQIDTDASVRLSIVDHQKIHVMDFGVFDIQSIAPDEEVNLAFQYFDASSVYAGAYNVLGELLDETNQVLTQAFAPFSITTSSGGNLDVGALVNADKPVYQGWDQANIELRVQNLSTNSPFDGGVGTLRVYRPSGALLAEETFTLNSLVPQGLSDRQYVLPLVDRESGLYQVKWVISQNGEDVATSLTTFDVERLELFSLVGSVALDYYPTGEAKTCHFSVFNRSAKPEVQTNLIYQLINMNDGNVLYEIKEEDVLISNVNPHPFQLLLSDPPEYGGYVCIVMAEIEGELQELAAAGFNVTPPSIESSITLANKGKLLVLVDGLDTTTQDVNDPVSQRRYLESHLQSNDWYYTLTDNANDFTSEFHSGLYSAVAIFSDKVTLNPETEQLLVEAQNSGLGLLVGGSWNRRNNKIEKALGIKLTGKNNHASAILDNGFMSQPNLSDALVNQGLALAHCDAEVWATFNTGKNASDECAYEVAPAAVTAGQYGLGDNSYFAFDILDEATTYQGLHEQLLLNALLHIQPNNWSVAAGSVVPLTILLNNESRKAAVDLGISLPQGGQIIESTVPLNLVNGIWVWQYDFSSPSSTEFTIYVKLPNEGGDVSLAIDVKSGINRQLIVDNHEKTYVFGNLSLDQEYQRAKNLIAALEASGSVNINLNFIIKKLDSASIDISKNNFDKAINSILLAIDKMADDSANASQELRLILDAWLYQIQQKLN
ncbi:putative Ig domain-containing protein [Oceaniserpentilla sp. 4NH20-0058]|uniref:putative Ig domain-containing protein n=1 Tax=Oceaniserpentilla sp. 4NH20-0058 TaxID=3127660 RepID=UPI00333F737E